MAGADESKATTAALLAGFVLLLALVVPLFFLFRMASAPKADPAEVKNVPKVRKDKAEKEGGKKKGRKGAMDRMRDAARGDEDATGLADRLRDDAEGDEVEDEDPRAAAKRAERLAAAREREEAREAIRERDEQKNAARRQKDEAREEKQRAKEEAERLKREEEAKKQQEEFDKWKDLITVDDEGTDETEANGDSEGLLANFVSYIKEHKVVVLEDLAATFELRVQDVISRVQGLEAMGCAPPPRHVEGLRPRALPARRAFRLTTRAALCHSSAPLAAARRMQLHHGSCRRQGQVHLCLRQRDGRRRRLHQQARPRVDQRARGGEQQAHRPQLEEGGCGRCARRGGRGRDPRERGATGHVRSLACRVRAHSPGFRSRSVMCDCRMSCWASDLGITWRCDSCASSY